MNIKKVIGQNIIVKRFKFPEKTSHGLYIPQSISNDKDEVGTTLDTIKYQNRGEVVAIGKGVEELSVGDIVIFTPNSYTPVMTAPDSLAELASLISGEVQAEHIVLNEYSVLYVES